MTTVLKLGGSVITDKDRPKTVDEDALDTAVEALATAADERLVVVHGGGSFGHPPAEAHGVSRTEGTHDAQALTEIHRAMGELNDAVVSRLHAAGVSALPVRPLSAAHRTVEGLQFSTAHVTAMLEEGFVPVLHGDAVAHAGAGCTIVSGDELVVALARGLATERVGLCSAVSGVLDGDGEVIPEIDSYAAVEDLLEGSDATDVTGGMAGKVEALLALEEPAAIFSLAALSAFLETGTAGTVIR